MTGDEKFVIGGREVGFNLLDYWRYQYSNVWNNLEYIAEFLVAKALGKVAPDNGETWTLYDICYRGCAVEVKQTSDYHTHNNKVSSVHTFDIHPAHYDSEHHRLLEPKRQADVYVFCYVKGNRVSDIDPLDLNRWEFYVVPVEEVNCYCTPEQKHITLSRFKNLGWQAVGYEQLKETVDKLLDRRII